MTSNQINNRANEERERSNRAQEGLRREDQKIEKRGQGLKFISDLTGNFIKAVTAPAKINDPSWYNLDKQLTNDVASISTSAPLGTPFKKGATNKQVTGIAQIKFCPMLPGDGSSSSPLNIAARSVYSYVRHANSGSKNYDAPDLMNYLLGFDSVYMLIAAAKRAYRMARTFSTADRYFGDKILDILPKNDRNMLKRSPAEYRSRLNKIIQRVNSFYVPGIFPVYKRHEFLCDSAFVDNPDTRTSQVYIFTPTHMWKYGEKSGFLSLETVRHDTAGEQDTKGYLDHIEELLDEYFLSEDIGVMSGDILKAYGADKCITIAELKEDEVQDFGYSDEVMNQIHNATLVGAIKEKAILNTANAGQTADWQECRLYLSQDSITGNTRIKYGKLNSTGTGFDKTAYTQDCFITNFELSDVGESEYAINKLLKAGEAMSHTALNLVSEKADPDTIMVATRLMVQSIDAFVQYKTDSASDDLYIAAGFKAGNCPTEVVERITLIKFKDSDNETNVEIPFCILTGATYDTLLPLLEGVGAFDWFPKLRAYTDTNTAVFYINVDWNVVAPMTSEVIKLINAVAVLSEFGCPVNALLPRIGK